MKPTINFHCSQLGVLMGDTQKPSTILTNRCKALLQRIYYAEKTKHEATSRKKFMDGTLKFREQGYNFLAPYNKDIKLSEFIIENAYIKGRPRYFTGEDIIHADSVLVINSLWDLNKFSAIQTTGMEARYYWQLQGYMALTNATYGRLFFCLINTPADLIENSKDILLQQMCPTGTPTADYQNAGVAMEQSLLYNDMPVNERIKEITIPRDNNAIEQIYRRIKRCRRYIGKRFEKGIEMV